MSEYFDKESENKNKKLPYPGSLLNIVKYNVMNSWENFRKSIPLN